VSVTVVVRGLEKSYRDGERRIEVLRRLDLEVEAGEMVAIVGPSGSGKSTLLHILGALDGADAGTVDLDGTDVLALDPARQAAFRRRFVGFVFQFHELLPDFTALENVILPGRIAGRDPREAFERARGLLAEVGLADRADHYPNELSGGERQRVALCRALSLEPPLLLADEPTGNLDPASGQQVFELLVQLSRRHGTTALVVTHNPAIAAQCDRVLELREGRLHDPTPEGLD
jgi:lipoprotein-releasing system ATP-binding protein